MSRTFDWRRGLTVREAADRHKVRTQRVYLWIRDGPLPFKKMPGGRGGNGWKVVVCPDRVAELAAAVRAKTVRWAGPAPRADRPRAHRKRTVDGGREVYLDDPIAEVARAPGWELTAADRAVLAERRGRFEARKQRRPSCSSR